MAEELRQESLLKTGALQNAIFNSANFSTIATDAKGVIQIFNVGAERMLGYAAADVLNKITPADISDPKEVIARARALSVELSTPITPGFEALVFKASRGIEDIYELTYIRKDGSRFPAVVSVTALRDDQHIIIGYLLIGTDNTARKQAEEALRANHALLVTVHLHSIVSVTDRAGRIVDANEGFCKISGYNRDELLGQTHRIVNSGVQTRAFWTDMWDSIVAGQPWRGEICNRTKEGSLYWVDSIIAPFMGEDGHAQRFISVRTDITARKRAEEALPKAVALQSAIFNSANFSSIATDAKGVIQIFNVGAERMLGFAAAEVMNKITPADISDPQEVIARAIALSAELGTTITPGFEALVFKASRGIEDIYELTYIRKDGSRFPAVVSVTALRDAHNTIIGFLLIGTDNTARKQVEAEQRKLDQRLRDQQFYTRSLIESNIDALMTTDQSGIISDVNKQMEALTGCTRDELIGAPFKNYFTDAERAEAGIKRVLKENKVTNYELTARARDGKETVVSYNATTFYDRDRNLQGVFAAARDVTERMLLDRALQETNVALEGARFAAEKANLAKSDFLSSMSHELRSPLNAILGFAQLMESGVPLPTPSQKDSIAQILQAGWYLLELINEILDLSLIESGKLSLCLESLSMIEVLNDCQAMIEPQAQTAGIRIRFPAFDHPYFVKADRTRVKQIVVNLLSNAIKYNRAGGTVEVTCTAVTAERTRIGFHDTGEGLSPEKMAQLFQPFNRLGQEAGTEQGTGIGLVVSKRLVELMAGESGVESPDGVGSVFWSELNSAAAEELVYGGPEVMALSPVRGPSGTHSHTILCVEDNPANLMLIERLIGRRPDIQLLSAKNGSHGIEIARAAQPDAILMDINLPGISGIKALQILSDDPATAHIPVIALSANAMAHDIEKGLEAGFFRYLTKPIKVNEFMETLDIALKHSLPASDPINSKEHA
ncbi:MAG: PAS domain S-box protein [Rhizobacter sp.]|nr:PAS domain S-box protein [Rhizobacter sp.]